MSKANKFSRAGATGGTASGECGSGNPLPGTTGDAGKPGRDNLQPGKVSRNSQTRMVLGNRGASSDGLDAPKAPALTHAALDKSIPRGTKLQAAQIANEALVKFRGYQRAIYFDRETGLLILHWSRQIGKSYVLAAWAVDRLLSQLTKYDTWLVTVLSNSRDNGAEFALKCAEVCNKIGLAKQKVNQTAEVVGDAAVYVEEDQSPDLHYHNMRMEIRITMMVGDQERVGRIKVLAANPRTARGFSGDLILDEFAFHEDSNAIWDAAEPILSAKPEFMCRIASTGNGRHNMFYRMAAGEGPDDGTPFESASGYTVSRVTRTSAWKQGVQIWDLKSKPRRSITPEEAQLKALDKRSYLQNYECKFTDENMRLLTDALISDAESSLIQIDEQQWSAVSLARMHRADGDLCVGNDIGRNRDLSVVTVINRVGQMKRVIGMLRMKGMRLPDQQRQLDVLCRLPKFRGYEGDMTGLGLGLVEYLQEKQGTWRVRGVNFASTEPMTDRIRSDGRKGETARVTEIMAVDLLAVFEERSIKDIPMDQELRDDLIKPEKLTSPGGRVSIAATRDEAGHADHFWSLALAVRACGSSGGPFAYQAVERRDRVKRGRGIPL